MSTATEAAEPIVDAASEAILEGIDGTVEVLQVVRNNPRVLALVWVAGCVAGGSVAYFASKRTLRKHYEEISSQEIAEAKAFYANLNKVDEDGATFTPMDALIERHGVEEAAAALKSYQGDPVQDEIEENLISKREAEARNRRAAQTVEVDITEGEVESVRVNVFADPSFDLEEEKKYRTEEAPYVITHDEFFQADMDYENSSLTYYEMDDTLVDERDMPIEGTDEMIGDDNLVRFGHGSRDRNIVYVRNDRLGIDFEITKSMGSYLEEVLGMTKEEPNSLKHSDRRDVRRALRYGDG